MPKGIPLTPEDQAVRRREIVAAAARLFLDKGFQETSLREIAQAAGMGKSSLYDYFTTKDEILVFVIVEQTLLLTEQAQAIARLNLPPGERLKQMMARHLEFFQANKSMLTRLTAEAQRLRPESQRAIQEKRYAYQDLVAAVIQEGITQGCFRAVNPLLSARLLINSLVSVLYTTRPAGSPQAMLDEVVDIILTGIKL